VGVLCVCIAFEFCFVDSNLILLKKNCVFFPCVCMYHILLDLMRLVGGMYVILIFANHISSF
jgi:hypothetical protein